MAPSNLIQAMGEGQPQEIFCLAGEGEPALEDVGGAMCWDDMKVRNLVLSTVVYTGLTNCAEEVEAP